MVPEGLQETTQKKMRVSWMVLSAGFNTAPHLSFVMVAAYDEDTILNLKLNDYKNNGVKKIVALRGDLPSGFGAGTRLIHANFFCVVSCRPSGTIGHRKVIRPSFPNCCRTSLSFFSLLVF